MTLEKGTLLHNRYRVEETIAVGGMGAIYRALDETLGIQVAVKENFFTTEEYSRQFRREATILASLRHPNMPRVTDHFVIPGQGQYLVMDFIEGIDLRDVITQQGNLSEEDVIRIGSTICDALAYLHSRSPVIVHRDIKPGNLKITPTRHVFLVDFGLAKISHGETTTTGAQALTPGYAPPEQYGQGTDPRSDIYSLGATLYAALTGKIPEDGLSRAMGSAELTPIRKHNSQVTEPLAKAIEHAMAIAPGDRYPTAMDFREGLLNAAAKPKASPQPFITSAPTAQPAGPVPQHVQPQAAEMPRPAAPPPVIPPPVGEEKAQRPYQPVPQPQRKRGFPLGAVLGIGGVAALAGIAILIFGLGLIKPLAPAQPVFTFTPPPPPTHTNLPTSTQPLIANLTPTLAASETPTLAPSATSVPTNTATPAATLTATQAPTPLGGAGGQIAYSSEQEGQTQVWIINSDGSDNKQITHLPDGACQPDWSPDGKQLVFISPCQGKKDTYPGSSLFIINADGTGLTPLVTLPGGDFEPAWSPDGTKIVFTSLRDYSIPHLYLYNLADNTVKRLSKAVNRDRQPAWSPDGKLLAYETTTLNQPQIWTMTANGENAREFSSLSSAYDFTPAWAPDGSVIVFSQGSQRILVARQVGDRTAQQFPVSDRIYPAEAARFSTDGWWLAFDLKKDGNSDIYIMTRNGANLTRLTTNPGVDFHPAWRP